MAYDQKFRTKIVEYFLEGYTHEELSELFNVSMSSIKKWTAVYRESGTTYGGYRRNKLQVGKSKIIDPQKLELYIKEFPNAVSRDVADIFSCSVETARKALLRVKREQQTEREKTAFFSNYPKFWYEK